MHDIALRLYCELSLKHQFEAGSEPRPMIQVPIAAGGAVKP
jgi:hypothetical protein